MNKSSNHQSGGNDLMFLLRHVVLSRLIILFLLLCSDILISDHVPPRVKVLSPDLKPPISALARWDSAWFLSIAEKGYPIPPSSEECDTREVMEETPVSPDFYSVVAESEQPYAFFPLYPYLIRFIARHFGPIEGTAGHINLIITGCIVSAVSFLVATCALHQIIKNIFHGRPNARKEANFTVIAFCWNPAGVFFSVCYTESIFAALVFTSVAILYSPNRRKRFWGWISAFIFGIATLTRSNGILNILLVAHRGFTRIVEGYRRKDHSVVKTFGLFLETVLQVILVVAPLTLFQLSCYRVFCLRNGEHASIIHPWCTEKPSILSFGYPSLYSWVQKRYWHVGFLHGYTFIKIPNFILAAPTIYLSVWTLSRYVSALWKRFVSPLSFASFLELFSLYETSRPIAASKSTSTWHRIPITMFLPLMVHWAAFLPVCVLFANVQVTTRLIAAACPAFHWSIGRILSGDEGRYAQTNVKRWLTSYIIIGSVLHANMYPWT